MRPHLKMTINGKGEELHGITSSGMFIICLRPPVWADLRILAIYSPTCLNFKFIWYINLFKVLDLSSEHLHSNRNIPGPNQLCVRFWNWQKELQSFHRRIYHSWLSICVRWFLYNLFDCICNVWGWRCGQFACTYTSSSRFSRSHFDRFQSLLPYQPFTWPSLSCKVQSLYFDFFLCFRKQELVVWNTYSGAPGAQEPMIFETEVVPWSWPAKNYVSTPPNLPCMVDIDKVCYV